MVKAVSQIYVLYDSQFSKLLFSVYTIFVVVEDFEIFFFVNLFGFYIRTIFNAGAGCIHTQFHYFINV